MRKSLALAIALVGSTSGAVLAQALFDAPGSGYREQRDRVERSLHKPVSVEQAWKTAHEAQFRTRWWEDPKNPEDAKLEVIAIFSSADKGAAEQIRRALTDAGILFLVPDKSPFVKVDPLRVPEAKALLRKVAEEKSWTLRTVTVTGEQMTLDGAK